MYEYKGPIKFWYDLFPSILVILICCGILCSTLLLFSCEEKAESSEPNESETSNWMYITDLNEPMKYSLPIPTWPDYIELEKDIYIEIPIEGFGLIETRCYVYRKGTKIYFKDN